MLWNNPDNMPRHEVELTLLGAAILSGDGAIAHQVLELGAYPTLRAHDLYSLLSWEELNI